MLRATPEKFKFLDAIWSATQVGKASFKDPIKHLGRICRCWQWEVGPACLEVASIGAFFWWVSHWQYPHHMREEKRKGRKLREGGRKEGK